jgi:streptogrisin C
LPFGRTRRVDSLAGQISVCVQRAANFRSYSGDVKSLIYVAALMTSSGQATASTHDREGAVAAASVPVPRAHDDALSRDARAISPRFALSSAEAERQLRLQQASVATTDAIAARFAGRLAGIAVEHSPSFRIVVRLTGAEPVADQLLVLGDETVTITFVTGARATHVELVQAIAAFQAPIRASLLVPPALGVDQRTGELVAVVSPRDVAREGAAGLRARLAALTHVPVRLRVLDQPALDMSGIEGGMRMVGSVPGDTRRYLCTAGFVVTDGARTALATAAHCPDALRVRDAAGQDQDLAFEGQWGWGNQDLQINSSATLLPPTFFADTTKTESRTVTGSQSRAGTRAGDVVCHRGERTGYSCSVIELTDFAPSGDLCGGACLPTWTTVAGPTCKSGDSGAPVFLGTTAYGLLKGGSYRSNGSCAFYFYMSTDYLPPNWRLLTAEAATTGGEPVP